METISVPISRSPTTRVTAGRPADHALVLPQQLAPGDLLRGRAWTSRRAGRAMHCGAELPHRRREPAGQRARLIAIAGRSLTGQRARTRNARATGWRAPKTGDVTRSSDQNWSRRTFNDRIAVIIHKRTAQATPRLHADRARGGARHRRAAARQPDVHAVGAERARSRDERCAGSSRRRSCCSASRSSTAACPARRAARTRRLQRRRRRRRRAAGRRRRVHRRLRRLSARPRARLPAGRRRGLRARRLEQPHPLRGVADHARARHAEPLHQRGQSRRCHRRHGIPDADATCWSAPRPPPPGSTRQRRPARRAANVVDQPDRGGRGGLVAGQELGDDAGAATSTSRSTTSTACRCRSTTTRPSCGTTCARRARPAASTTTSAVDPGRASSTAG